MSLTSSLRPPGNNRAGLRIGVIAVLCAIGLGTVAFHRLEGWSILDSLYVTAQTVTTVGFGDLTPRTIWGRAFATVFMMVGVGIVLYALTSAVQSIVQSEMVATFGRRRLSRKMSKLQNHFIICGAGRVGSHLMRSLRGSDETFIVIESNAQKVSQLLDLGIACLLYTSPSPRDRQKSRMPSSA